MKTHKHENALVEVALIASTERVDYSATGVDTKKEDIALTGLHRWLDKTLSFRRGRIGDVKMKIGFFANILDLRNGLGIAFSTDGVGTKILVARMMNKYDTIGIDCIAMNVNDILCVGAEPIALVDYLAVQEADPTLIEQIAKGLHEGARIADITIPGGEIAQIPEMLGDGFPGIAFDIAGAAIGTVRMNKIISGNSIRENDVIIGLRSSGVHSNGLTMARKALLEMGKLSIDTFSGEFGRTIGEELLEPTTIYVPHVMDIIKSGLKPKALVHITSDGFLNLRRVESPVGFIIEELPESQPIFSIIQRLGNITDEEMYRVYNMGIGFCVIVADRDADKVMRIAKRHGTQSYILGHTVKDPEKQVVIRPIGLIGRGDQFFKV